MAVFANDSIGNAINIFGAYEREELATLFEFLAPYATEFAEGVALDIGANIGNHALAFAPFFRTVHAFEPHPETYQLLAFNASFKSNIIVHNFGLGDEAGKFRLAEPMLNIGESFIDPSGGIEIELKRLDDLEIENVRFLKIDVEGFESRLIAGGLNFLRCHKPIIAFEQLARDFDGDGTPAIRALKDLGYHFCWLQDGAKAGRKVASFTELKTGRLHRVMSGEVPARTHALIIALPAGRQP